MSSSLNLPDLKSDLLAKFEALKAKLEESHQTLELIIGHLSEGLIFISNDGIIKLFNPEAEMLTGLKQADVVHSCFWEHFSDTFFGFSLRKSLHNPSSHHRVLLTLNENQEIELSSSSVPGKGILLLLRDRTEIRQLEASVHHNEQLAKLGQMAATLAHEIRNPLGGVEGFARLLQRDLRENSLVVGILEGTQIINNLIANVLNYSCPLNLHFTQVDLVQLVRQTLASDPTYTACEFVSKMETYPISIDSDRIKLVLHNLIRNALEAKSQTVHITLTSDRKLTITDDGEGIPKENLEKIFTPFFTTKATGTGLGLAEVAKVMEGHGGKIFATSENGTTFTLEFAS